MVRAGLPLVKKYEQCRLTAFIPVPGDPWTLGWGRTKGIVEGQTCTQDEADSWIIDDYDEAQEIVLNAVTSDLTDNQLGALTSFVYNVGPGIPSVKDGFCHLITGGPSHLLIYANRGDWKNCAGQFSLWVHAHGITLLGLVNRRKDEAALFLL